MHAYTYTLHYICKYLAHNMKTLYCHTIFQVHLLPCHSVSDHCSVYVIIMCTVLDTTYLTALVGGLQPRKAEYGNPPKVIY